MPTYQQAAPAQRSGTDVAAWALVALVVAIVCAVAGWAIARNDTPGNDDVARMSELAARNGEMMGTRAGFAQGAAAGRREASLRTKQQVQKAKNEASRSGFVAGYDDGRARAEARSMGDGYYGSGSPTGAYPAAGYEDVLASGLFGGDAPGYTDSAFSDYGYGRTASAPYAPASALATSPGDDAFGW